MLHPSAMLLTERKAEARRLALARRKGADPAANGAALARHLLARCPPAAGALVAGYWPMGDEMDVRPLLAALAERGHHLALPVTTPRGQPLRFRRWRLGEPLSRGPLGTSYPAGGEEVRPDWLLVPLLAFDRAGRRLGYGAGYYDRTLAALPGAVAIGCAHAVQEVPEVPAGPHDVRLAWVATENGVFECRS
jgi:5-formyltetrahydrofolate cyclo-ligase